MVAAKDKAHDKLFQHQRMKFGHYYIVEVAFDPNNVVHRAIACEPRTGWPGTPQAKRTVTLFAQGYEAPDGSMVLRDQEIEKLEYFRVVGEIHQMQGKPKVLTTAIEAEKGK